MHTLKKILLVGLVSLVVLFLTYFALDARGDAGHYKDLYERQTHEFTLLKKVLNGEYEKGNRMCSSVELLIACYDEVNSLRATLSKYE